MSEKLLNEIAYPIMMRTGTMLLGISSMPVDENSPMFQMMDARYPETGKHIIKSLVFENKCPSCKRKGRTGCKHKMPDEWSDKEQMRIVKQLMKNNPANYMREMLNERPKSMFSPAFPSETLDQLIDVNNDYRDNYEFPFVFIGLDPNGGGRLSRCSMVDIGLKHEIGENGRSRLLFVVRYPATLLSVHGASFIRRGVFVMSAGSRNLR